MKKYHTLAVAIMVSMMAMPVAAQKKNVAKGYKITNTAAPVQEANDSIKNIIKKADAGDAVAQNTVGSWYYRGINTCKKDYKMALQYWAKSAKQGNALAIGNMAVCYQMGNGTQKDSTMAVQLYDKSVEKGNLAILTEHEKESAKGSLFSSMYCAHCYSKGIGVKKDAAKVASFYIAAAKQGSIEAMRSGALTLLNSNNAAEAVKLFEMGAAKKDPSCMYWYGKLLLDGKGVKQDRDKAFVQLMMAADRNFTMAIYQVGMCYKEGWGTEKDAAKAAENFGKAAVRNLDHGKWAYAVALANGDGVKRDFESALYWFSRSIKEGNEKKFGQLCNESEADNWTKSEFMTYLKGMKAYREGNITDATKLFKTIEKTAPEASVMLALCQISPKNKKPNAKKGMKMLTEAAETNPRANYYIAKEYQNGNDATAKDAGKFMEYMKKAADANYYLAQCDLGDCYFEGRGVARDYAAATKLYIASFNSGMITSVSATRLATCYENAWGVEKNTKYAESINGIDTADHTADLFKLF